MNGIPIARLFGIEIRVHLGWVIVLGLIGYIAVAELQTAQPTLDPTLAVILGGVVAIGFFASSLVHDLAHALMARRRGMTVPSLAVSFFGGSTPLDPIASKPADELAIAVAGPFASIGLGIALLALALAANAGSGTEIATVAATLGVVSVLNFILGFVNLLPAYPLDGGRIACRGTHEELLETSPIYREIHDHGLLERQFADAVEARADVEEIAS